MRIWHQSSTTFLALLEKDIARYFKTNRRLGVDPFQAATEIITAHAKTDPLVSLALRLWGASSPFDQSRETRERPRT